MRASKSAQRVSPTLQSLLIELASLVGTSPPPYLADLPALEKSTARALEQIRALKDTFATSVRTMQDAWANQYAEIMSILSQKDTTVALLESRVKSLGNRGRHV